MDTKHTPTPWRSVNLYKRAERGISGEPDAMGTAIAIADVCAHPANPGLTIANAAHIVRCVNSHDALVAALRVASDCLPDMAEGKGGWAWEEVLDQMRAALEEARK